MTEPDPTPEPQKRKPWWERLDEWFRRKLKKRPAPGPDGA